MDEHLRQIQKDVDEMNKAFDADVGIGDVKTDPPATDPPDVKTDPPTTEEPFDPDKEVKTDPPETKAPKTDPPATDPPDERDQIIEELRQKLAEKEEVKPTAAPATKAPLTFDEQNFLEELEIEDVEDLKPEDFNKLLNKVYQKAVTDTSKGADVTQSLPGLITMVTNLQKTADTFYEENKDLVPFKKVVATVWEDLSAKDPNKPYDEVIAELAPLVREHLKLPDPKATPPDKKPPSLPRKKGKPGRSKQEPTTTPLQADIEEMNKVIRR